MEEIYQVRLEDSVIARNGAVKLAKPLQSSYPLSNSSARWV